jgi:hypothetical protein
MGKRLKVYPKIKIAQALRLSDFIEENQLRRKAAAFST